MIVERLQELTVHRAELPKLAAQLSTLHDTPIVPCEDGIVGFRVGETPTHWIEVHEMLFNFRLVRIPKAHPLTIDGGWCYYGTRAVSLLRAISAAVAWDGVGRPAGWDKDAFTGEYATAREEIRAEDG